MVADIDPNEPGLECYGGESNRSQFWLYSAQGKRLSDQDLGGLALTAVFWDGSPTKSIVGPARPDGPPAAGAVKRVGPVPGRIVAVADCLGDWREEVIVAIAGEIHVYSSTIPATTRRTCLMQDRQYRTSVAMQTMGYLYPPLPGGMPLPAQ